jgi:phosphoglucosamine mutase
MDTRVSGRMLEAALNAGACSVGAKIFRAGVLPTPGIAYLVRKYNMDAGVVLSASHNSMEDNGIKFFSREGMKLPDAMEEEIEALIEEGLDKLPRPTGTAIGTIEEADQALEDYVEFLAGTFTDEGLLDLKGLKVAIDCANGAGSKAGPALLKRLGAEVSPIFDSPDGTNINKGCGSTHIEALCEYVKANGQDIGIALDGDGDRLICVDETGKVVDGDQIMSICGVRLKQSGKLKKDTLVATVMSNLGLFALERERGIHIEKTGVGDRYVLERMLEIGATFGGEQSGHVIFLDYGTTGDGLMTALQVLKAMRQSGLPLSKLNTVIKVFPQVTVSARVNPLLKDSWRSVKEIGEAATSLEEKYEKTGRVLIRASGTENVVRIMIEGEDEESLKADAKSLADLMIEKLK